MVKQNVTIIGEIINGQGQVIEQNTNDIVELQAAVDNNDDRIELNSNSIKSLNSSFAYAVDYLDDRIDRNEDKIGSLGAVIDGLYDVIGEYDDQIEMNNNKINEVDERHKELRNDFEYLKYEFRYFTIEISNWQIDVDTRLNKTEDQIQGILCCKTN